MSHVPTPRDISAIDEKGAYTDQHICTIHAASDQSVTTVLSADPNAEGGHARSQWLWFRLQNGDLILGCFPQDGTYFMCEVDAETPREIDEVHQRKIADDNEAAARSYLGYGEGTLAHRLLVDAQKGGYITDDWQASNDGTSFLVDFGDGTGVREFTAAEIIIELGNPNDQSPA